MRVAMAWFDYDGTDTFARMSAVVSRSFEQVMGITPDVIPLAGPAKRQQKAWKASNTIKLQGWIDYVEQTYDDVILIDADVLAAKDVTHVFEQHDFDVAITTREPGAQVGRFKMPYNGGVVFVRNTQRALDFLKAWKQCNQDLLDDGNLHKHYSRKCAGMNQPALVRLLQDCGGHKIAKVIELECKRYNACGAPHWMQDNQDNVHLLHCKSGLRTELGRRHQSPYSHWVDYYREIEREIFGDTRPGSYAQVTGSKTHGGPLHGPRPRMGVGRKKARWQVVHEIIKDIPDAKGVEVGVWHGNTLFKLLEKNTTLHMTGVDPYAPFDGGDLASRTTAQEMDQIFETVAAKAQAYSCEILRKASLEAADDFGDASLDFVFLDGNHRYESVLKDIAKWLPKVKPGGYLIGHDWKHHILGDDVERAVKATLPTAKVQVDSNLWYYKCA